MPRRRRSHWSSSASAWLNNWAAGTERPSLVGRKVDRYQIVAHLGSGGMGDVYRATDTMLGRDVALKVLTPALHDDTDFRRRLEKEARAASSLNHPNIVTVYEIGQAGTIDFVASELVGRRDAARASRRGRPVVDARSRGHLHPGCRGALHGAWQRHRAPRHQAGERHDPARRHRQGGGLRAREANREADPKWQATSPPR